MKNYTKNEQHVQFITFCYGNGSLFRTVAILIHRQHHVIWTPLAFLPRDEMKERAYKPAIIQEFKN